MSMICVQVDRYVIDSLCPGRPAGGRVDGRAGEAEGDHRGAGADLRRDVRILVPAEMAGH